MNIKIITLKEEEISFFKLSSKIESFIRRAEGALEEVNKTRVVEGNITARKYEEFVHYMESVLEKVQKIEDEYRDIENDDEKKAKLKEEYAHLKLDAKRKFKRLKGSTGRWLWAITDDPKLKKTLKLIFLGFFALLGVTVVGGAVAGLHSLASSVDTDGNKYFNY
jgi:DNA repair ATPase RecN